MASNSCRQNRHTHRPQSTEHCCSAADVSVSLESSRQWTDLRCWEEGIIGGDRGGVVVVQPVEALHLRQDESSFALCQRNTNSNYRRGGKDQHTDVYKAPSRTQRDCKSATWSLPKSASTLSVGMLLPKSSWRWYALCSSVSSFSANTLFRASAFEGEVERGEKADKQDGGDLNSVFFLKKGLFQLRWSKPSCSILYNLRMINNNNRLLVTTGKSAHVAPCRARLLLLEVEWVWWRIFSACSHFCKASSNSSIPSRKKKRKFDLRSGSLCRFRCSNSTFIGNVD